MYTSTLSIRFYGGILVKPKDKFTLAVFLVMKQTQISLRIKVAYTSYFTVIQKGKGTSRKETLLSMFTCLESYWLHVSINLHLEWQNGICHNSLSLMWLKEGLEEINERLKFTFEFDLKNVITHVVAMFTVDRDHYRLHVWVCTSVIL